MHSKTSVTVRMQKTHQNSKTQIISIQLVSHVCDLYHYALTGASVCPIDTHWSIVTKKRKEYIHTYLMKWKVRIYQMLATRQTQSIEIPVCVIQSFFVMWVGSPFAVINKCTRIMQFSSRTTPGHDSLLYPRLIITGTGEQHEKMQNKHTLDGLSVPCEIAHTSPLSYCKVPWEVELRMCNTLMSNKCPAYIADQRPILTFTRSFIDCRWTWTLIVERLHQAFI